ncbi:IS3 family transposase [Bacillus sp. (in: firmicutes)]
MHDYIEYYNMERIQEKLNYLSPMGDKKHVT